MLLAVGRLSAEHGERASIRPIILAAPIYRPEPFGPNETMPTPRYAAIDGELVRWEKANVHVSTHALHYGTGAFEGIRAYYTPQEDELSVWELDAHLERLVRNMSVLDLREGPSKDQLWGMTMKLPRANGVPGAHDLRTPLV